MSLRFLMTLGLIVGIFALLLPSPGEAACGSKCNMLSTCYECDFSLFFSCNWKWCDDCSTTACGSLTEPDATPTDGLAATLDNSTTICVGDAGPPPEMPRVMTIRVLEPRT